MSYGYDDCNRNNGFDGCGALIGENTVGHPGFLGGQFVCDWIKDSHVQCWFFVKDRVQGSYDSSYVPSPQNNGDPSASLAYLDVHLYIRGDVTKVPASDFAFLLYDVSNGAWTSTFQKKNETHYVASYGAEFNNQFTPKSIELGFHKFQVRIAYKDEGWEHTGTNSRLHWNSETNNPIREDYAINIQSNHKWTFSVTLDYKGKGIPADLSAATELRKVLPMPPPPPPPAHVVSPVNFSEATSVNVADLGPPDIVHNISQSCNIDQSLADMRMIFNTVVCGQWAGAVTTTSMLEDSENMTYNGPVPGAYGYPPCEAAMRSYIGSKTKVDGNRDYLPRRFDWDVSFVKLYT